MVRGKIQPRKKDVLDMTINCIYGEVFIPEDLGNMGYPFIQIIPKFILIQINQFKKLFRIRVQKKNLLKS